MSNNNSVEQNPREIRLNANGLEFSALEWGTEGQLPILALHGWLDNAATFYKLAPQLKNVHIIAPDLAGHGRSQHRPGQNAYTPWDDINDIFALADQLGWKRFALLGHSRGAIIGSLAAGTFPERFIGLGLIEGMLPEPAKEENVPAQLASAISGLRTLQQKTPSVYTSMTVAIKARERGLFPLSTAAATALTERGVIAREGGFSWSSDRRLMTPSVLKLTRQQLAAFINRIAAPVKLLLANNGLPELYENYLAEVNQFPHVDYEILQGGHHLHMEQAAELVAEKLNHFFGGLTKADE
jgi:pimeloyl-ACP methyl ester carboxylesterase